MSAEGRDSGGGDAQEFKNRHSPPDQSIYRVCTDGTPRQTKAPLLRMQPLPAQENTMRRAAALMPQLPHSRGAMHHHRQATRGRSRHASPTVCSRHTGVAAQYSSFSRSITLAIQSQPSTVRAMLGPVRLAQRTAPHDAPVRRGVHVRDYDRMAGSGVLSTADSCSLFRFAWSQSSFPIGACFSTSPA